MNTVVAGRSDGRKFYFDGAAIELGDLPLESTSFSGVLKRYNGSSFVKGKLKVYNGSIWADAVLKRWDGAAWVEVDATGV